MKLKLMHSHLLKTIGNGDEVIVPSNTYIATALTVTYVGATPVFIEPAISIITIYYWRKIYFPFR